MRHHLGGEQPHRIDDFTMALEPAEFEPASDPRDAEFFLQLD